MKKVLGILSLMMIFSVSVMAQTVINGKVKDKKTGEALAFVTVVLTKQGNATPVANTMTDEAGAFLLDNVKNGNYDVAVTYMGYKEVKKNVTANGSKIHLGTINLEEEATALKEVTVTGQRSTVKLEVDRKSFDVSQDITNAGGSASDALENIPSVEVDQDGNVSLRGNSSVEVWINGRQSGLTSDNRGDILKQLPAESIEKIEVIDNPSAKYSAEGSAGIINIVLKKNRKAGYYGSIGAGANTRGGANANFNINYNSSKIDAFASVGYRHMQNKGHSSSEQTNFNVVNGVRGSESSWSNYATDNKNFGNNLFTRLGATWHMTDKDDLGVSGNFMVGGHNRYNETPYHYGWAGSTTDYKTQYRDVRSNGDMLMQNYELNYRHTWSPTHLLDFVASYSSWGAKNKSYYRDKYSFYNYYPDGTDSTATAYTYEPFDIKNNSWEIRLDYENQITDWFKLEAGYNAELSHENTPNEQWTANNWDGTGATLNAPYYNRFLYDIDTHALYSTLSFKVTPKFSAMLGLRGEYWTVKTKSYGWDTTSNAEKLHENTVYKKDFFKLFPSVFLSYQLTENDQLQLNYTRRLRRPHGGELNSFMNTSDASYIHYGNPELTPEYSNSFSLNYLKQFGYNSILVSAYYRATSDVMEHVSYQMEYQGVERIFQTSMNIAKNENAGVELTMKNKFFKILDLTTNVNLYNRHVSGFDYSKEEPLMGKLIQVKGDSENKFTWNARVQAALMLPAGISVQLSGRYRSKEIEAQGYRNAIFMMEGGVRKTFGQNWTLAVNCRDILNSRKREAFTDALGFTRHAVNRWGGRNVNFTLTYSFGNSKPKMQKRNMEEGRGNESEGGFDGYSVGGE